MFLRIRVSKVEEIRFWNQITLPNRTREREKCWEWKGTKQKQGYGLVQTTKNGKLFLAHRVAYFLFYGIDPGVKLVCHKCDNPPCCNPSHLFLGDALDNVSDCMKKGRKCIGEKHPHHKLCADQVRLIRKHIKSRKFTLSELARQNGVSMQTIHAIVHLKKWKHI